MSKGSTKLKRLGRFDFGIRSMDVIVDPVLPGGSFDLGKGEMVIGLGKHEWADVVSVLIHESMEVALSDVGARYVPTPDYGCDAAAYMFHFNHSPQFSEACGRVAYFIVKVLPLLATEYRRQRRSKRVKG